MSNAKPHKVWDHKPAIGDTPFWSGMADNMTRAAEIAAAELYELEGFEPGMVLYVEGPASKEPRAYQIKLLMVAVPVSTVKKK